MTNTPLGRGCGQTSMGIKVLNRRKRAGGYFNNTTMWQYIIIAISALMLFGFVALGVVKFGWLSCYSAYGPKWHEFYPKLNVWSVVTALSALLMVPVLLEQSAGNPWQFLGFLAPVSLTLVAASPDYQEGGFQNILHQVGAIGGALFILIYICIIPKLLWAVIPFACAAVSLGLKIKGTLLFWLEMAVYLSTYVILIVMIAK